MPEIARKGDQDDRAHTITSGVVDSVKIDGQPVAVKGSQMEDGIAITGGCIATVKVNGQPIAVKGSTTDVHQRIQKGQGTIKEGSSSVKASG